MIAGILAFLIIGCMILLRSDEKKRSRTKQYQENIDMLNETNEMLDTTLMELELSLIHIQMCIRDSIVTDSMTMQGVANYFDTNERNLLAVKAGVDILDIPFTDISSMKDMESKLIPLINAFVDAQMCIRDS